MDKRAVIGTCMLMCPEQEMDMRQKEGLIHVLESRREGSGRSGSRLIADRRRMVKEYTRSAAGRDLGQPHLLRPPPILKRTVNYLLSSVVLESDVDWTTVYLFVSDRLRAVRQDMVVQETPLHMRRNLIEPMVRFYAYAAYRLCEEPRHRFDPRLNYTQLNECFIHLLECYNYEDDREKRLSETRDQMEALRGLLHLGNVDAIYRILLISPSSCMPIFRDHLEFCCEETRGDRLYKARDQMEALFALLYLHLELPWVVRRLRFINPPRDSLSRIALQISIAFHNCNYVKVFRKFRLLPPLLACVAAIHLPKVRREALAAMNHAYSRSMRYPLSSLTKVLMLPSNVEAMEECRHYGITVDENGVRFSKTTFDDNITDRPPKKLKHVDDNLSNIPLPELLLFGERES